MTLQVVAEKLRRFNLRQYWQNGEKKEPESGLGFDYDYDYDYEHEHEHEHEGVYQHTPDTTLLDTHRSTARSDHDCCLKIECEVQLQA